MDKLDLVLAIIDASGGKVEGRTVLQKLGYFASLKAGLEEIRYKDYFYGPFSKEVAIGIEDTRAALLVNETVRSSPIESYTYTLTDDGREIVKYVKRECPEECAIINKIVTVCKERRVMSAHPLACAAKAHYILAQAGDESDRTPAGIERMARGFGWNLKEADIKRGVALLESLNLPVGRTVERHIQAHS